MNMVLFSYYIFGTSLNVFAVSAKELQQFLRNQCLLINLQIYAARCSDI